MRRVDRTSDEGHSIVLIPAVRGERKSSKKPEERDRLCLWQRDPVDGGGQTCASTDDAIAGKLSMSMFPAPVLTSAQRKRLADYLKAAQADAGRNRKRGIMIPGELANPPGSQRPGQLIGLVPDGVAKVRVGTGQHQTTVPVVDNLFVAPSLMEEEAGGEQVWLTPEGTVYPVLRGQAVPRYLPRPSWAPDEAAAAERLERARRADGS